MKFILFLILISYCNGDEIKLKTSDDLYKEERDKKYHAVVPEASTVFQATFLLAIGGYLKLKMSRRKGN